MQKTKVCPKCQSRDVVRIPGTKQGYGPGNNISSGIFSQVLVSRYLCCSCGFIENWLESADDIIKVSKKYKS